jgi:hypothetical protein
MFDNVKKYRGNIVFMRKDANVLLKLRFSEAFSLEYKTSIEFYPLLSLKLISK